MALDTRVMPEVVVVAFSSHARILGEDWSIRSPLAFCCSCCCCKVEINWRTIISLFWPGSVHSGSAECFPDELRVSSFPDRFTHYAWTAA